MAQLPVGTMVTWRSQANGHVTTKHGNVLGYVPPQEDAYQFIPGDVVWSHMKFRERQSQIARYVVLVETKRGPRYYTPRASLME